MRKAGHLDVATTRSDRQSVTQWMPIAEIAARMMIDQHKVSIDRIMTSPTRRQEFDRAALAIDPDADLYSVRKAALVCGNSDV